MQHFSSNCNPPPTLFSPQEYYDKGEYIIREGEEGSTFYIIAQGKVTHRSVSVPGQDPQTQADELITVQGFLCSWGGSLEVSVELGPL